MQSSLGIRRNPYPRRSAHGPDAQFVEGTEAARKEWDGKILRSFPSSVRNDSAGGSRLGTPALPGVPVPGDEMKQGPM